MDDLDDEVDNIQWPFPEEHVLEVELPVKALEHLREIAESLGTSCEALARLSIGRGLREDMRRRFEERVVPVTEQVLAKRLGSEDDARAILKEIRERLR